MASKNNLFISQAAASAFFLRIALLNLSSEEKGKLITIFSEIITGRLPLEQAALEHFCPEGEALTSDLQKAILRSARAREAACRRKAARGDTPLAPTVNKEVAVEITKEAPSVDYEALYPDLKNYDEDVIVVTNEGRPMHYSRKDKRLYELDSPEAIAYRQAAGIDF